MKLTAYGQSIFGRSIVSTTRYYAFDSSLDKCFTASDTYSRNCLSIGVFCR